MAFAAPVQRGDFSYNGDLYADAGNFNRHKRASVEEITKIIRPDLKKSKAAASEPLAKDQPAHFFAAQCLHYGLQPSKDKARCKMRLLEALNSSSLKVPSRLIDMEAEMKKEFAKAERKAKANLKASMGSSTPDPVPVVGSKKRKQVQTTTRTGDSSNVNGSMLERLGINAPSPASTPSGHSKTVGEPVAKKARMHSSAPSVEKKATDTSRPKQTAGSPGLTRKWLEAVEQGLPPPGPPPVGFHITAAGRLVRDIDGSEPSFASHLPPIVRPGVSKGHKNAHADGRTKPKKEPRSSSKAAKSKTDMAKKTPRKEEPKPKKEPKVKQETPSQPASSASRALGLINGVYDIECPELEGQWSSLEPDDGFTLILTLDTPIVWGAYGFGMFSGVIRLDHRPTMASSTHTIPFHWRGRENSEGQVSYQDYCQGSIRFLGNGIIEGRMDNLYGDVTFQGTRRPGPGAPVRTAGSMKDEWDDYNEDAYEREERERWY